MNDILIFILASFATYRIAHMLALETGPFEIFMLIRTRVFEQFGNSWVNEGFNCVPCISFWIALLFTAILIPLYGFWTILWWMAISGAAVFLHKVSR